jgi:hypothetical protein
MQSTRTGGPLVAATAIAVALVAVVAVVALGAGRLDTPEPSTPPSTPPSAAPSTPPSAPPTTPSTPPANDHFQVDVDVAAGGPVTLLVEDTTGAVVDVRSGPASDGMSVRWGDVIVANIDANTVRVTWAGLPGSEDLSLTVRSRQDKAVLDFVQQLPPANSDAMGLDRVIVIEFDRPVRSEDVVAIFPDFVPAS